jgi:prophage antirepressor-like protein/FtsZ-binding cell division protein ZapB
MEVIEAFENNGMHMHITIQGTREEPLFRASDIAAIFEMTNIRVMMKDFDNTEKVVNKAYTPGGEQNVTFLTEKGLYQVLFTSRKPIAKKFKNWVCEVIRELRLNGKYQLEKQIGDINKIKEQNLITNFSKTPILYIGFAEDNVVKPGYTDDIERRLNEHKRDIRQDFTFEYIYESSYNREIERQLYQHPEMKKRRIKKSYPGREEPQTELFNIDSTFTLKDIDKIIREIKNRVESTELDKDKNNEINKLKNENNELKNELIENNNQIYKLKTENKELKEKLREYTKEIILTDENTGESYNESEPSSETTEFLVVRHIKTTKETLFSCPAQAAKFINFDPKSLLAYIDYPRLIHGYHVRKFGNSFWQPCKEYTYDENSVPYKNCRAIKSINLDTNQEIIYESLAEAIKILEKDDTFRSKIGKYADKDKIFEYEDNQKIIRLKWNYVTPNTYGEYRDYKSAFYQIDGKNIIKNNSKTKTKIHTIIARNIETCEEIYCKHATEARKIVGNSDIANYLNQPVHIKGFSFRTIDSEKYWIPPDNFKYISNYVTKQKFYIKAINKFTKEVTYYNSAFEMAIIFNLCKLTDDEKTRENMRELVKRVITGEVKTANHKILNDHILEQYESCGYYIYKNGNKEIIN